MEKVYDKELFYCDLYFARQLYYLFERPLNESHLKPVKDVLFDGKELTPFSRELFSYQEARKCVLDFDIYTMEENYEKFPNVIDLLIDCYRYAAQEGVMEACNNIGVFFGMVGRMEEAVPWFEAAAEADLPTAMVNLMGYYGTKGDYDKQFYYVERLASMRHLMGMYNYALSYHFGYMGRQKNIEKAKDMYQKMMSLVVEDDMKDHEFDESLKLSLKTYANYNLAKLRLLTETHSEENLKSILNLLEHTPYVLIDQPRIKELGNEIRCLL